MTIGCSGFAPFRLSSWVRTLAGARSSFCASGSERVEAPELSLASPTSSILFNPITVSARLRRADPTNHQALDSSRRRDESCGLAQGTGAAFAASHHQVRVEGGDVDMRELMAGMFLVISVSGCGGHSAIEAAHPERPDSQSRCARQTPVDLDVPGPGTTTPERAVAPYAGGPITVVMEDGETATVSAVAPDGTGRRVFRVTRREDGWWPDSYTECSAVQ